MTDTDNKSESEIELEEEIEIKKELIEEHKPVEIEKGNGLIHIYIFFYSSFFSRDPRTAANVDFAKHIELILL